MPGCKRGGRLLTHRERVDLEGVQRAAYLIAERCRCVGSEHDLGLEVTAPVLEGDDVAHDAPALMRTTQHTQVQVPGPRREASMGVLVENEECAVRGQYLECCRRGSTPAGWYRSCPCREQHGRRQQRRGGVAVEVPCCRGGDGNSY